MQPAGQEGIREIGEESLQVWQRREGGLGFGSEMVRKGGV